MKFVIRRSRQEESGELINIWCRSVDATHGFLSAKYRAELEEIVRAFLPSVPLWVATTEDNSPVAFMLLNEGNMEALFVDPQFHGCGVGRSLVEHALQYSPVLTTTVNEQNDQAAGFYKTTGFVQTGRSETDDLGKPYPVLYLVRQ